VVYDRTGGGAGSTTVDFVVPPAPRATAPRLYGPVAGQDEVAGGPEARGNSTFPFRAGSVRVLPVPRARFTAGTTVRFFALVEGAPGADAPVRLAWRVETGSGEPVGLEGASDDARGPWHLEIPGDRLAPGSYRLAVTASADGVALARESAFEITASAARSAAP
jgi:hypothetical protein